VHDRRGRLFVGTVERVPVGDVADAAPTAPVEGFHVEGVADEVREGAEVEAVLVAGNGGAVFVGVRAAVRRDEPGFGDVQSEPDHGDVGGVFFHALKGEGVVEQVHVVEQGSLFQPFARLVVPPREAVDDEVVGRGGAQVEGVDADTFDIDLIFLAFVGDGGVVGAVEGFEHFRPVVFVGEEETDFFEVHRRSEEEERR